MIFPTYAPATIVLRIMTIITSRRAFLSSPITIAIQTLWARSSRFDIASQAGLKRDDEAPLRLAHAQ